MKNILSIALCATAIAAFGEDIVVSETQVGIYPVKSSTKNTLIAVSLKGDDGQDISVSNLVKTANLTPGDKLYAFKDGLYEGWTLDVDKRWQKANTLYTYTGSDTDVASGTAPSDATAVVGSGIWLVLAEAPTEEFTIYMTGQPVTSPTTTIVKGKTNLVGNPTKKASTPVISGAVNGDVIEVPNGATRTRYQYNGTDWSSLDFSQTIPLPKTGLPSIPANTGFWYISKGNTNFEITWN